MSQSFKILGINHVGIAPKDTDQADTFFRKFLALPFLGDELVKEQKTHTFMFSTDHNSASSSRIELLANKGGEDGPIARFLEKKGGGIHHIALTVDHLEAAIRYLQDNQIALIDNEPRKGAHNTRIAFIHPKSTGGVLVELVQEVSDS